jgi:hypothetical protein
MADIEVGNRATQKLVAIACPGCGQLYSVEAIAAKRDRRERGTSDRGLRRMLRSSHVSAPRLDRARRGCAFRRSSPVRHDSH